MYICLCIYMLGKMLWALHLPHIQLRKIVTCSMQIKCCRFKWTQPWVACDGPSSNMSLLSRNFTRKIRRLTSGSFTSEMTVTSVPSTSLQLSWHQQSRRSTSFQLKKLLDRGTKSIDSQGHSETWFSWFFPFCFFVTSLRTSDWRVWK